MEKILREDSREVDNIRKVNVIRNYTIHAEGSVLISFGNTKVICTASVSDKVPPFLRGQGKGWITAEYSMLPSCRRKNTKRICQRKAFGKNYGNSKINRKITSFLYKS